MRPISLAHLTVIDADPITLIDAGEAGGFDAIGLRIVPPTPSDRFAPIVGNLPLQRRIKSRLAETGLAILDVEAIWLTPDTDVENLLPALDLGAELGARYLLVCGNDPDRGRMAANFARLCGAANARGLRAMLEFIPYTEVKDLASARDLLQATAPANAGLLVDALHLSRSGGGPGDIAGHDPSLFSYVHLCDAPLVPPGPESLRAEARGGRLDPGEGGLRLSAFLDAFPPGTPVAIEAPSGRHAALSPVERGRRAGEAARALIRRRDGEAA